MSARGPTPHATGYEDAITRRIAALEQKIAALEAGVARERAQAEGLAQDNARLRTRTAEAERGLLAGRRARTLGIALSALGLGLVALAAVLRFAHL